MADKEEKTKKAFLGAKTKINQLNSELKKTHYNVKICGQISPNKQANMLSVTKICDLFPLPSGAKEQLSQEVEELKQSKEELEVRMNALKSQYEGRLLRLDRELRERRETQTHSDTREETQDQSGAKVQDGFEGTHYIEHVLKKLTLVIIVYRHATTRICYFNVHVCLYVAKLRRKPKWYKKTFFTS